MDRMCELISSPESPQYFHKIVVDCPVVQKTSFHVQPKLGLSTVGHTANHQGHRRIQAQALAQYTSYWCRLIHMADSLGNLLSNLYDDDVPEVQKDAVVSVVQLATKHSNKWEISDFPDALAGIIRLLFKDECPHSQTLAAWALANLSFAHALENKEKIAVFPQVLSGLVRLLAGDHMEPSPTEPSVQEEAVRALRNLACAQENSHTMALFPGAVPGLLKLLFDDSRPGAQTQATMAVLNLIGNAIASLEGIDTTSASKQLDSAEFPDVLKCLVRLWFSDASPTLQAQAIGAIIDLVERTLVNPDLSEKGGNMQRIADFPDALLRLLDSYMT